MNVKTANFEMINSAVLDADASQLADMAKAVILQYVPLYQHFCEVNMANVKPGFDFRQKLNIYNKLWKEIVASEVPSSKHFDSDLEDIILWDSNVDVGIQETLCAFEAGLVLIWATHCTRESNMKIVQAALNFGANQNFEKLFPTQLSSVEQDIFALEIHSEIQPFFSLYPKYLAGKMAREKMIEVAAKRDFAKLATLQAQCQL